MTQHKKQETITAVTVDDLRKMVLASLAAARARRHNNDVPLVVNDKGLTNPTGLPQAESTGKAVLPNHREAEEVLDFLTKVVSAAFANATMVANHLDHIVEHLMAIGCTSKADVEDYFRLANRTLASLYFEAAKAHPSPHELTKFALRFALDPRRPIKGDLQRFEIRRLEDFWEVVEYPSVAMRVPAIRLPGRIVKNIFAVRIFDYLQERPPEIFRLMGLIESLLDGVPALKDCLGGNEDIGQGALPEIEVNLEKFVIWLDGEDFHVKPAEAYFADAVVSACGDWISSTEIAKSKKHAIMIGPRPDRVHKRLPKPIRNLIDSAGGRGFRLRMA